LVERRAILNVKGSINPGATARVWRSVAGGHSDQTISKIERAIRV